MFKIFSKLAHALTTEANAAEMAIWVRDPLFHPEIEAMDSRELGDLPFGQEICSVQALMTRLLTPCEAAVAV